MKKLFLSACVLAFAYTQVNAQGNWLTAGNTLGGTEKLGSLNSKPLKLITANKTRMTIMGNGKVGIGVAAPKSSLELLGGKLAADTFPAFSATVGFVGTKDVQAIYAYSEPAAGYGIGMNAVGGWIGAYGTGGSYGVVGLSSVSGVGGFAIAADTTNANNPVVTGVFGESTRGHFSIGVEGHAELGWRNYGVYGSTDTPPDTAGLDYAGIMNGDMFAVRYYQASDARVKQNITPYTSALNQLAAIKPSSYEYRHDVPLSAPMGRHIGLIAENVAQTFPELVKSVAIPPKVDRKGNVIREAYEFDAVNYIGLIPVLVSAVNQQQEAIIAKDMALEEMKAKIALMEKSIAQLVQQNSLRNGVAGASLVTVSPNPAKTNINFVMQSDVANATLTIISAEGKVVYSQQINNRAMNVSTDGLADGTYIYSVTSGTTIIANGTVLVTK
ncbi:MAG: tail fiber domain-containing protein [Bacteroidetes bacterium]|nr:tail fiber domain-containing protein [Bacteroidota bacterium]